jgi:sugar O-acyltransferase (sialic acid O-acetyltransferase NeuD family)
MSKVIIFGNKDFAQLAHFYLENDSPHKVSGFTLDREYIHESSFLNLPVIDFENIEKSYPPDEYMLFIPMSPMKVNQIRAQKYLEAKKKGYSLISYVSSKASYYNTPVGDNCFILENNVIQPFCKIGNNVMMWSGNHIGHHSIINDHCFFTSHVVVSGHVTVGEYSFFGVNATLRDGIDIGKSSVIGAGALILENTEEHGVYPGIKTEKSKIPSCKLRGF